MWLTQGLHDQTATTIFIFRESLIFNNSISNKLEIVHTINQYLRHIFPKDCLSCVLNFTSDIELLKIRSFFSFSIFCHQFLPPISSPPHLKAGILSNKPRCSQVGLYTRWVKKREGEGKKVAHWRTFTLLIFSTNDFVRWRGMLSI